MKTYEVEIRLVVRRRIRMLGNSEAEVLDEVINRNPVVLSGWGYQYSIDLDELNPAEIISSAPFVSGDIVRAVEDIPDTRPFGTVVIPKGTTGEVYELTDTEVLVWWDHEHPNWWVEHKYVEVIEDEAE